MATLYALGHDEVVAFLQLTIEIGDEFWRILKVAIHDHDIATQRGPEACRHCDLLPKIAAQPNAAHGWIALRECFNDRPGIVRTAVVDDDDFERRHELA